MELSKLNQILSNLRYPDGKLLRYVQRDESVSGEEASVYEVIGEDNLYLRIDCIDDSYGDGNIVSGVQFVKAKEKKILSFETI